MNMGQPGRAIKHSQTEMTEFNDILSMLYQKDGASFFASGRAKSKERFVLSSGSWLTISRLL